MVNLNLDATRLGTPASLSVAEHERLIGRAERQLDMPSGDLVSSQVLRLAVASALESRLLHTRRARLETFSLFNNPEWVTLAQLAALQRHHYGAAGQAFELAVADAVQAGDPAVVEPLIQGLAQLNIPRPSTLKMIVTGLEKVRPAEAEGFYAELGRMCPDDAVLRTGAPGRPASVHTALMKLCNATWASMDAATLTDSSRRDLSQLGRADALVVADGTVVAVSLKVNRLGVSREPAWRDVPLWITTGLYGMDGPEVTSHSDSGRPKVVVQLRRDRWAGSFMCALWVLDHALAKTDHHSLPPQMYRFWDWDQWDYAYRRHASYLARWMVSHQDLSVAEICQQLRQVEPGAREMLLPVLEAAPVRTDIALLGAGPVIAGFEQEADDARLVIGHPHLFFQPLPTLAA